MKNQPFSGQSLHSKELKNQPNTSKQDCSLPRNNFAPKSKQVCLPNENKIIVKIPEEKEEVLHKQETLPFSGQSLHSKEQETLLFGSAVQIPLLSQKVSCGEWEVIGWFVAVVG